MAEHLIGAFDALCAEGPLCGEKLRGVRFELTDAKIHAEAAQRRAPQVVPAARRAMAAALTDADRERLAKRYDREIREARRFLEAKDEDGPCGSCRSFRRLWRLRL